MIRKRRLVKSTYFHSSMITAVNPVFPLTYLYFLVSTLLLLNVRDEEGAPALLLGLCLSPLSVLSKCIYIYVCVYNLYLIIGIKMRSSHHLLTGIFIKQFLKKVFPQEHTSNDFYSVPTIYF